MGVRARTRGRRRAGLYTLAWQGFRTGRAIAEKIGLDRLRLGGKTITERCGPLMRRLIWRVFGPHRGALVAVDGHSLELGVDDPPVPEMVLGVYDQYLQRWLIEFLRPGMTVLDVGAHIGYFSLIAARQVGPSGRVWAFEPAPGNYQLLLKNIERNGYTNIVAVPKAISNHSGSLPLYLSGRVSGAHSIVRDEWSRERLIVPATSIDEFLASAGWPHIDLVKMDIQGAEMIALQGAAEFLGRNRPLRMIVEFWPGGLEASGADPAQFLALLSRVGFRVLWASKRRGELREVDPKEVIAASYRDGIELMCTL